MTKKAPPPKEFSYQGVDFHIGYAKPAADKHKSDPCRGRINPLDPMTGKCLTKRQLFGKASDAPVNHIVHGKDPWDIYNKREAEASYLISVMAQRALLSGVAVAASDDDADLAELARNYKQTLFDIHPRWMKSTVQKYIFNGNVSNVSETSLKLLFTQLDSKAKRTVLQMKEGFYLRWEYMRRLMPEQTFSDAGFDSLDAVFNLNRPTDNAAIVSDLCKQYEAGALSKQSFIEQSPYTNDAEQEMKRIAQEGAANAAAGF